MSIQQLIAAKKPTVYERLPIEEILKGDGRKRYLVKDGTWRSPAHLLNEKPPTASMVRLTINAFEQTGRTNHSSAGLFVPYVVAYCHWKKISYALSACFIDDRCAGYEVKCIVAGGSALGDLL